MLDQVYPSLMQEGKRDDGDIEAEGRGERVEREERDMSALVAAGCVVDLVEPFVAHIHHQYTSNVVHTHCNVLSRYFVYHLILPNVPTAGSFADLLDSPAERVCRPVSNAAGILLHCHDNRSHPLQSADSPGRSASVM